MQTGAVPRKIDARMCVPFSEGKTDKWLQSNVLTCAAHQILRRDKDIVFESFLLKFFNLFVKSY